MVQGLVNIACQIVGAILGSAFVYATVPSSQHGTLGANVVSNGFSAANAFCGEAVMSFVLVAVVLETAVNKKSVARAQVSAFSHCFQGLCRNCCIADVHLSISFALRDYGCIAVSRCCCKRMLVNPMFECCELTPVLFGRVCAGSFGHWFCGVLRTRCFAAS